MEISTIDNLFGALTKAAIMCPWSKVFDEWQVKPMLRLEQIFHFLDFLLFKFSPIIPSLKDKSALEALLFERRLVHSDNIFLYIDIQS